MTCDLRGVHDPVAAVAFGDGETQCSKVRSDKVRTDEFAEPSRDRALQFIHRLSRKAPIHLRHYFAEPSSDRVMRFTPR